MGHEMEDVQLTQRDAGAMSRPCSSNRRFVASVCLLLFFCSPFCAGRTPRQDPATGRLRILFIGTAFWGTSPGRILLLDPKIDATLVPIITVWYTDEENARYMRLYMPKSYDDLVANKDLVHLAGVDAAMITPRWQNDFTRAVTEQGLGLLMTNGHRGFGGASAQKGEWKGTRIEQEVLPVYVHTNQFVEGPIMVRVLEEDDPLMRSLPWKTAPPLLALNKLTKKEGATLLADDGKSGHPALAYWDLGQGASVIFACDLHGHYSERWVKEWGYWHDFVLNLEYYSCGADVPSDPEIMHLIRNYFSEYAQRVALLRDMMGFIEKFGASSVAIEEGMSLVEGEREKANALYLEQNYQEVLDHFASLLKAIRDLESKALRLKDRALQWIYVSEWLAVSGALMACGVVVWALMVQRKLYREIGTTRAR